MVLKVKLPKSVIEILSKFKKNNFEIYIVGGAVRDLLTGKSVYDWDFTTNATPDEILKLFPDGFYDNSFGTVGIKNDDFEKPFEITTFRTESGYSDNRRPDKVSWGKSLEEDTARRDFTINAMALNSDLDVIDFYNGQKDLADKKIKAVGNPNDRFREDALRMMRAIRIATQLNFNLEEKTFRAIKDNAFLINKIAKERIKDELFKLILSPNASDGITLLRESNLLDQILPELVKCFGVEQKSPGRHHIYDVGTHLLMSLKECKSQDPITRFATLIHDIGKPVTYKKLETGTITFYNHEMVSTKIAENIADRLKFSKKEKDKFLILVRWHQFTVDERQTDNAVRRFIRNVGKENIPDMLDLRVADRLGGGARETSWRLEEFKRRIIDLQKEPFSIKDLKINGRDVMKILKVKSGPIVGKTLDKLFKEVENKKIANEKEALINEVKKLAILK